MKDGIYVRIVTFVNRITVRHRKTSNVNFQVILAGGSLPGEICEICVSQNVIFNSNLGIPTFFLLVLGGYPRHPWRENKVQDTEDSVKNHAKGFDRKL